MTRRDGPRPFWPSRDGSSPPPSILPPHIPMLTAIALSFVLSQGCAALGLSLLGTVASTAGGQGVSYTLGSPVQKTFTAPAAEVKASVLAALGNLAYPVESNENEDAVERIVAKANDREVEAQLEAITPQVTKLRVVVREGWFWKDRATAAEIVEQTERGLEAAAVAARAGRGRARSAALRAPAGAELRPAAALLDAWDPEHWREGFGAPPTPTGSVAGKTKAQASKREAAAVPVSAAPVRVVASRGGRAAVPEGARPSNPPAERVTLRARGPVDPLSDVAKNGETADNRWRVIRKLRLRVCPGRECASGAVLKRGDVVARLREKDEWWQVSLAGRNVVGWVLAKEVAPQNWWDPAQSLVAPISP